MRQKHRKNVPPTSRRRWDVTTNSITAATGRDPRKVREDINAGVFEPWDTGSLARYVMGHILIKEA